MKGTCYFEVSCLQWKPLLQLFGFGSHLPVAAEGYPVCAKLMPRSEIALLPLMNKQIPTYFHALPYFLSI